jgi:hypothetical protein|tara:strand:+ start:148 stop:417 length:270 start_codon:yes stop_codon:yes gene_type:complete
MPNDLTLASVQELIRSEVNNALQQQSNNQSVITTNDNQTSIDYRAVCDFMSGQIFDFCITSDSQEVREFGKNLALKLGDKFNISDRWNV